MTDKKPLLISKPECRMAERISLALAIKGLSFRTSAFPKLNKHENDHSKIIERGFPLLLIEKDGASGWVAALDLMEKVKPEPSLFPNGNRGMPIALSFWSEHAATKISENGNFSPYAELIARQISDGRQFLQGDAPGLADIESYIAVSGVAEEKLSAQVAAWRKRMLDLKKSVSRQPVETSEAESYLKNLENITVSAIDMDR